MRLLKNNKGQIRVIEAFFASIILLSVLTLIPSGSNIKDSGDQGLMAMGQRVLLTLDNNGYLSKLIENSSWATLRKCIQSSFSPTIWFNLMVFNENNTALNDVPIGNGTPINSKIISVEYICASQSRNYGIYIIRLQLSVVS